MKLSSLLTLFREEADDTKVPYLWGDVVLTMYANQGQQEACRRARLIKDSSDPDVCQYAVTAGDQFISLDPRIIYIRHVRRASQQTNMGKVLKRDIDLLIPNWDFAGVPGDPIAYVSDRETGKLWFDYPFTNDDTILLEVVRMPLADISKTVDPEINDRYQWGIVHWMLHRAYGKQDAEANDPKKAENALAQFELEFGQKMPAIEERWIEENQGYDEYEGLR